jgi:regulatory protein
MRGDSPQPLRVRALQWLAQREHSRVELRRKLLHAARQGLAAQVEPRASDPAAEVDALLDWLVAHRYLSDARFVESRVNARAARYGNLRIRQELGQHGALLDAAAAEQLRASELARARAVWARKYGGTLAGTANERARQMRFLTARGFSPEVVRRVVRSGESEPDDGF